MKFVVSMHAAVHVVVKIVKGMDKKLSITPTPYGHETSSNSSSQSTGGVQLPVFRRDVLDSLNEDLTDPAVMNELVRNCIKINM